MDFGDEELYYDEEELDNCDHDNEEDDLMVDSDVGQEKYKILTEHEVRRRQVADIMQVSTTLSITADSSAVLLSYYRWNISKAIEEWFANENTVRETVGLLEESIVDTQISESSRLICMICFETRLPHSMSSASCGHLYCKECLKTYICTSITDGPGCLTLRCPTPSCKAAIGQDMVETLVPDEDREKYSQHLLRTYIEENKTMKWCPSPDCEFVVDLSIDSESYNVRCDCGHRFCWNCVEETHRPAGCDAVKNWMIKISSEAENSNYWIFLNCKPCPNCNRPIQKHSGCMRMQCRPPCGFEFCWLCLDGWNKHGYEGVSQCNGYSSEPKSMIDDETKRNRELLRRYTHYYERWAGNHRSMQKASKDLRELNKGKLDGLKEKMIALENQMRVITEAWLQIVECRRVLMWSYVYGYYIPEDEDGKGRFFEFLQGKAESALEQLHFCAEKELSVHIDSQASCDEEFHAFLIRLTELTNVTRTYFMNLVEALENGLEDVN